MASEPFRISMQREYYWIAVEQSRIYSEATAEIKDCIVISEGGEETIQLERLEKCYERCNHSGVIGITFAAMSLEAFFYDYAAVCLGEEVAKGLDRLSLASKLLIVPRLTCGKQLEKSSHIFQKVKQLTRDRNGLVHFKSRSFPHEQMEKAVHFANDLFASFKPALTNGVTTVESVLQEIDRLEDSPRQILQSGM